MNNIISDQSIKNWPASNAYQENIGSKNGKKDGRSEDGNTITESAAAAVNAPSTIVSLNSAEAAHPSAEKISELKEKHAAYSASSLKINASAHKIWNILTDVNQWPNWVPGVSSASAETNIKSGSDFEWRSNGFAIKSTVRDVIAPYKITWDGAAFGSKAHHEWTLIPESGGTTTVTTSESFDGWLASLFPGSMQSTLDESLPNWLNALKKRAE